MEILVFGNINLPEIRQFLGPFETVPQLNEHRNPTVSSPQTVCYKELTNNHENNIPKDLPLKDGRIVDFIQHLSEFLRDM